MWVIAACTLATSIASLVVGASHICCAAAALQVSGGDLRKAVTTLQSAVRLGGNNVTR